LLSSAAHADRAAQVIARDGRDGESHVRGLPAAWIANLARVPSRAKDAIPLLDAVWKQRLRVGRPMVPKFVAVAWALWMLDPERKDAREFLAGALAAKAPELEEAAPEAFARLAESGPRVADLIDVALQNVDGDAHSEEVVALVDSVSALGEGGRPFVPTLLGLLRAEVARHASLEPKFGASTIRTAEQRWGAVAEHGEKYLDFVEPRVVLAVLHALESVSASTPEVLAAIDSVTSIPSDSVRIAAARARRVVSRRS
jgi:hypothetical protein